MKKMEGSGHMEKCKEPQIIKPMDTGSTNGVGACTAM